MPLVNLSNNFTAFGLFAVFDDDYMPLYEKEFEGCNIYHEPDKANNNPAHELIRIVNNKLHLTIILRPNRIDVQIAGHDRKNKDEVIKQAVDVFNKLDAILECPLATRVAYVSNDFEFDDYGDLASALAHYTNLLDDNEPAVDVSYRVNTTKNFINEVFNVVQSVNNVMISRSNDQQQGQRRALMISYDINTIINNQTPRFKFTDLVDYYSLIYDEAAKKLSKIDTIIHNKTI